LSVVPSARTAAEIVNEGNDFFDRTEELEGSISFSESHGTVLDRCRSATGHVSIGAKGRE